jgi:hypothetical protein
MMRILFKHAPTTTGGVLIGGCFAMALLADAMHKGDFSVSAGVLLLMLIVCVDALILVVFHTVISLAATDKHVFGDMSPVVKALVDDKSTLRRKLKRQIVDDVADKLEQATTKMLKDITGTGIEKKEVERPKADVKSWDIS